MTPPPMPEQWFLQLLAVAALPALERGRRVDDTLRSHTAALRETAERLWREAFLAGAVTARPLRMEISCDQEHCRLAGLVKSED